MGKKSLDNNEAPIASGPSEDLVISKPEAPVQKTKRSRPTPKESPEMAENTTQGGCEKTHAHGSRVQPRVLRKRPKGPRSHIADKKNAVDEAEGGGSSGSETGKRFRLRGGMAGG